MSDQKNYTINVGKRSYQVSTEIPKSILEPFICNASREAESIYKNWHNGAKEIYGNVIMTNSASYVSIFQAGMPNDQSMDKWVVSTALEKCHAYLDAMKKFLSAQDDINKDGE